MFTISGSIFALEKHFEILVNYIYFKGILYYILWFAVKLDEISEGFKGYVCVDDSQGGYSGILVTGRCE